MTDARCAWASRGVRYRLSPGQAQVPMNPGSGIGMVIIIEVVSRLMTGYPSQPSHAGQQVWLRLFRTCAMLYMLIFAADGQLTARG